MLCSVFLCVILQQQQQQVSFSAFIKMCWMFPVVPARCCSLWCSPADCLARSQPKCQPWTRRPARGRCLDCGSACRAEEVSDSTIRKLGSSLKHRVCFLGRDVFLSELDASPTYWQLSALREIKSTFVLHLTMNLWMHLLTLVRAGEFISIIPFCDMRQDTVTDFGYRYIVICHIVFSWFKRLHTSIMMWFCELTDCSHRSFL